MAFDPLFFPFAPNWSSPFREVLTHPSWSILADDGSEQTGSNASRPRRRFDYNILLGRDDAARFENMVFAYQTREFLVAHWGLGTRLTANVAAGNVTLPLNGTYSGFYQGGKVVAYKSSTEFEVLTVDSVSDTAITVSPAPVKPWPAGTRIYPLALCHMGASISGTRLTDWHMVAPVTFSAEPSDDKNNVPRIGAAETYQTYELFRGKTNWSNNMSVAYDTNAGIIDFGTGMVRRHSASRFTLPRRTHEWLLKNQAAIRDFRAWVARREGLALPVWMPTGVADFQLAQPIVADTNSLLVNANQYGPLAAAHPARRDIIIELRDGSFFVRSIGAVQAYSPTVDRLVVDANFPAAIQPSRIKRISLLNLYRLASQEVTVEWLTSSVARAGVNLLAKKPVIDAPPMSGGGGQIEG